MGKYEEAIMECTKATKTMEAQLMTEKNTGIKVKVMRKHFFCSLTFAGCHTLNINFFNPGAVPSVGSAREFRATGEGKR